MRNHKILNLLGIVSIAVAFVVAVAFNALAGSGKILDLCFGLGDLTYECVLGLLQLSKCVQLCNNIHL